MEFFSSVALYLTFFFFFFLHEQKRENAKDSSLSKHSNKHNTGYGIIAVDAKYGVDFQICPTTNVRVRINGHLCSDAISQLGRFICYNYERVSSECCERCLQVKNPSQVGK